MDAKKIIYSIDNVIYAIFNKKWRNYEKSHISYNDFFSLQRNFKPSVFEPFNLSMRNYTDTVYDYLHEKFKVM